MKDLQDIAGSKPLGYFVHHQGRGHALRAAAILNALPISRPVRLFCARDDIFPELRENVKVERIPSLFERQGDERGSVDSIDTPETLHCAPLGWPGIREAMARITGWFASADPALMIVDVSAEIAQLSRICSVPHVAVVQHGERGDPGHRAGYDGAAGLLCPFHRSLAQPEWPERHRAKMGFFGGLGVDTHLPERAAARRRLGIAEDRQIALVITGGGGNGLSQAPLSVAARALPEFDWITIGKVQRDWHATEPANLSHRGWVEGGGDYIAAADLIVASTGNSTCGQVLTAGKPWIAVPEWRYFDEQVEKAKALARVGACTHLPWLPSSAASWIDAVDTAKRQHCPERQKRLIDAAPAQAAADWVETLIARLWGDADRCDDTYEQKDLNHV
ncbi:glycosyltransferase [Sulfitobacter aestuarii]|uniref:Glycosyltransferase n=1 Tax=Sulfitobacter aestuarii TaxID=2161676 RepID=A0ABW5U5F8_9RHOB